MYLTTIIGLALPLFRAKKDSTPTFSDNHPLTHNDSRHPLTHNHFTDIHNMDEFIPISDFEKRYFPDITDDEKKKFIIATNKFERISITEDQYHSSIMMPAQAPPAIAGQLRAINLITDLATNQNLIPIKLVTSLTFDKSFSWFRRLHKNVLYNFALQGKLIKNNIDYPQENELGMYRNKEKYLGAMKMPPSDIILKLLADTFNDYIHVYKRYHDRLSNPRDMELSDWKKIEKAAHQVNLEICCIKPFNDASNRVGRLTENLLRLNTGLKFKTFDNVDLLPVLTQLQKTKYAQYLM